MRGSRIGHGSRAVLRRAVSGDARRPRELQRELHARDRGRRPDPGPGPGEGVGQDGLGDGGDGGRGPRAVGRGRRREMAAGGSRLVAGERRAADRGAFLEMSVKNSVVVVGGGIMGVQAAWHLSQLGQTVTVLDQFDVPNQWAASGDHLRVFRMTYGKDAFYTEMALKSLPLWLELNTLSEELCIQQNGVLELASKENGYESQSLAVLKEQRIKVERLDREQIKKLYPMYNVKAFKWALFHPEGGMIWANRAVAATASIAQRKTVRIRSN